MDIEIFLRMSNELPFWQIRSPRETCMSTVVKTANEYDTLIAPLTNFEEEKGESTAVYKDQQQLLGSETH